jgi:hypothetical protein
MSSSGQYEIDALKGRPGRANVRRSSNGANFGRAANVDLYLAPTWCKLPLPWGRIQRQGPGISVGFLIRPAVPVTGGPSCA